jgi:glycosyltransferase involved in cell wall biosynthesis
LEAFAAGAPVIGPSAGGIGETIAPLGAEWSVDGDDSEWVAALERLQDESFVEEGGQRARLTFENVHSPKAARERLERVYGSYAIAERPE